MGYARAGFDVFGVDNKPHPAYPYEMAVDDAMAWLTPERLADFDAVSASPPCPRYSRITRAADRENHPDLVEPVRLALEAWGGPWVIENVPGAPMANPLTLCGSMFGLKVRRHRLFDTNVPMMALECNHREQGEPIGVYGHRGASLRPDGTKRGRVAANLAEGREAMGIDWLGWDDLTDAIPPAYTEYLGHQLLDHLSVTRKG